MVKSIRLRLLLWSSAILAIVVVGFATILYFEIRAARFAEIDSHLDTAAASLDATLRYFPKHELTGEPPPQRGEGPRDNRPNNPPDGGPFGPGFRQGPGQGSGQRPGLRRPDPFNGDGDKTMSPRERILAQLNPPPSSNPDEEITYFSIWRADGTKIKAVGFKNEDAKPNITPLTMDHVTNGIHRERIMTGPYDSIIIVGKPIEKVAVEMKRLRWSLIATAIGVIAVGVIGGWLVSRRIFRPIMMISDTASRISADNLSERIDEEKLDHELRGLATTLNGTFSRLQAAFEQQVRFTADASHELRTPLAVIRSQAELALLRERSTEEYKTALDSCLKSSIRMTDLVERLLSLARADAGQSNLDKRPVSLDLIVSDSVNQLQTLATEKKISLKMRINPVTVMGESTSLTQLVINLISNAIKYNQPGGKVRVTLDAVEGGSSLIVADTGVGIPKDDVDKLFERFYRVDKARSRAQGGTGLGLAICKTIVESHGGWIDVKSVEGKGSEFRVWLPAAKLTPP